MNGETLGENIWSKLLGEGDDEDFFFSYLLDKSTPDKEFGEIMETLYLMIMNTTIHLHTKVR